MSAISLYYRLTSALMLGRTGQGANNHADDVAGRDIFEPAGSGVNGYWHIGRDARACAERKAYCGPHAQLEDEGSEAAMDELKKEFKTFLQDARVKVCVTRPFSLLFF